MTHVLLLAAMLIAPLQSSDCYDPGLNSLCCPAHWVQTVSPPDGDCYNWFHDSAPGVRQP